MTVVGVVSPGAMGSALADALSRGGARVVSTVHGRSERTTRLAERARVELLPDLEAVVREADVVLSIVPPEVAPAVAADVVHAAGTSPRLLVELNAVSPATVRSIATAAAHSRHEVVDGAISGPPPWRPGTTRVYLSGASAAEVAGLPLDGVDCIVVGGEVGLASAVKMSTASIYKGTSALLAQALVTAHENGVLEHVLADLRTGAPELVANVERRLATAAAKSERYVAEMREIAATQETAGLTPALFEAIAEIYARLSETPASSVAPENAARERNLNELLDDLR